MLQKLSADAADCSGWRVSTVAAAASFVDRFNSDRNTVDNWRRDQPLFTLRPPVDN